jgi:hypothetical protein
MQCSFIPFQGKKLKECTGGIQPLFSNVTLHDCHLQEGYNIEASNSGRYTPSFKLYSEISSHLEMRVEASRVGGSWTQLFLRHGLRGPIGPIGVVEIYRIEVLYASMKSYVVIRVVQFESNKYQVDHRPRGTGSYSEGMRVRLYSTWGTYLRRIWILVLMIPVLQYSTGRPRGRLTPPSTVATGRLPVPYDL